MAMSDLGGADRILSKWHTHLSRSPDDGSWATAGGMSRDDARAACEALRASGYEATEAPEDVGDGLRWWVYVTIGR